MAENQHGEQPISFAEFGGMPGLKVDKPAYDRRWKNYRTMATLEYDGEMLYGHGKADNKAGATPAAMADLYQKYLSVVKRQNNRARLAGLEKLFRYYVESRIAPDGATLQYFSFYIGSSDGVIRANWDIKTAWGKTVRESLPWPIDFDTDSVTLAELIHKFNREYTELCQERHTFIYTEVNRDYISRLLNWFEKQPRICADEADPGDVLVSAGARHIFQIWNVSPTGLKIMVCNLALFNESGQVEGPLPLYRLENYERTQVEYHRLSYGDFCEYLDKMRQTNRIYERIKRMEKARKAR